MPPSRGERLSPPPAARCLLAVYGTLMGGQAGQRRAGIEGKLQPYGVERCLLSGILYDCGEYPGLVAAGTAAELSGVVGELYVVPDAATLARLDGYEGYDPTTQQGEFVRRWVSLTQPPVDCWVYFFTGTTTGKPRVPGGDWTRYAQRRGLAQR